MALDSGEADAFTAGIDERFALEAVLCTRVAVFTAAPAVTAAVVLAAVVGAGRAWRAS